MFIGQWRPLWSFMTRSTGDETCRSCWTPWSQEVCQCSCHRIMSIDLGSLFLLSSLPPFRRLAWNHQERHRVAYHQAIRATLFFQLGSGTKQLNQRYRSASYATHLSSTNFAVVICWQNLGLEQRVPSPAVCPGHVQDLFGAYLQGTKRRNIRRGTFQ